MDHEKKRFGDACAFSKTNIPSFWRGGNLLILDTCILKHVKYNVLVSR
jgi:hypothetical protein